MLDWIGFLDDAVKKGADSGVGQIMVTLCAFYSNIIVMKKKT